MNSNQQTTNAVTASINFDTSGKQHGYLSLPCSSNTSARGSVRIPISVISHGEGPTVTMIGGCHGDEYEGPITLMRMANEIQAEQIQGRLILLPCLNMPAVGAGCRLSPIDQLNMNRVFPGSARGAITERIADYITRRIVVLSDVVLDLHAGGKTLNFVSLAAVHYLADRDLQAQAEAVMIAFGAPNSLRRRELDAHGMLATTVEQQDKIFVTAELGGGGTATAQSLAIAYTGCRNVLAQTGLIADEVTLCATRMLEMPDDNCCIIANDSGMLALRAELGQDVYQGDVLAEIYPSDRTGVQPLQYKVPRNGVLMARHHPGLIQPGDCLAVIAEEVQR